MSFRNSLFALAAAVSAYGQVRPVPSDYSDRPIVKRQPPIGLEGLWQVLDPKTSKAVANFVVFQNGSAFRMEVLQEGKPDVVFYQGTMEDTKTIAGKIRDLRSASELWVPAQITIVDRDHLQESHGTTLTRATPAAAASFVKHQQFASLPVPAGKFDLNGIWGGFEPGVRIAIKETDGNFTMTEVRPGQPAFFEGTYLGNPIITGQRGLWSPITRKVELNKSVITIISPDHLGFENKVLYRLSNPPSHDLTCDDQNSNRVRDYYAWIRGVVAYSEHDHQTAKCWFTIGAEFEYAPALSTLSALLVQDSDGPPDYPRAFDLASRAAAQGDAPAELQLASLYREGKGTLADPVKARYWQQKAEDEQSAELAKMLSKKNTIGLTPMDIGRMSLDLVEGAAKFNPMAGGPCFNEMFVPAGNHPCQ